MSVMNLLKLKDIIYAEASYTNAPADTLETPLVKRALSAINKMLAEEQAKKLAQDKADYYAKAAYDQINAMIGCGSSEEQALHNILILLEPEEGDDQEAALSDACKIIDKYVESMHKLVAEYSEVMDDE